MKNGMKIRMLLDEIKESKEKVKALAESDLEAAKKEKARLKQLQDRLDLLYDLDDEEAPGAGGSDPGAGEAPAAPTAREVGLAFVQAVRARFKKKEVPQKAAAVLKQDAQLHAEMVEGTPGAADDDGEDGGLTVPQDISTSIQELRRASADNLEELVNVENVTTKTGSRVIEVEADANPWPEVEEGGEFQEQDTPKLKNIKYTVKKFGGILKVTAELLEDTAENILAYLKKWIAKKSRATRNAKILAALYQCVGETRYAVGGMDDLKDIFQLVLDPAIAAAGLVITNQTGFNYLDKLKDLDNNYVLQPHPTDKTKKLLFGEYPVKVLSNKVLKSTAYDGGMKVPVFCGCTKEAVTLFDRRKISIDISTVAGDLWGKDKTGIKVRDRFDVQVVDENAIVLGEIDIPTAG